MDYFTADTHFGHKNVAVHRKFESVELMDAALINQWNAVVKPQDTVYHLGDFAFGKDFRGYLGLLNGHIRLILGNHDELSKVSRCSFASVDSTRLVRYRFPDEEKRQYVWLSHYAHRVWDRSHYGSWHLYGHSHGKLPSLGLSMDVGVDARFSWKMPNEDFHGSMRPWSLEEIKTIMKGRAQHG